MRINIFSRILKNYIPFKSDNKDMMGMLSQRVKDNSSDYI